jgi:hypothetical protein
VHHIQDIVNSLFRKMPYESLAGIQLGDEDVAESMNVTKSTDVFSM